MNEEEKEILEQLREKRNILQEQAPKNIVIQNIKILGQIELKEKEIGAEDKQEEKIKKANLYLVEEYDIEKDKIILKYYADDEFIGIDNNGEFLQTGFAREKYESTDTIKDVLENLKEKEEIQKNSEEKTRQVYSLDELEELEAEQEKEECAETLEEDEDKIKKIAEIKNEKDDEKLAQMNHLQEMDANTMVNSYKNMEKALKLSGVQKFVIVYSEDAAKLSDTKERNSSRYSMIAVMDDGSKINLDNKLERVPLTLNSEEERIQTDADEKTRFSNNTASMYRIKGSDLNEAFSFEQGQYGEIKAYYGNVISSKGNKFVGDQLETDSVWPTSNKIREHASDRKGRDYAKDKKEEAEKHLEHGDEEVSIENSDGREETSDICENIYIPDTEITWEQLSKLLGDKNIEELQKEFYNQYEGNNSREIILEMQEEYKKEEKEVEEPVEEKEIEDEYEGRVPWDVTKH